MTTKGTGPKRLPGSQKSPGPGMTPNPVAQGISVALFAAAQDNCDCRACQVLKKVLSEMTDQYLVEG